MYIKSTSPSAELLSLSWMFWYQTGRFLPRYLLMLYGNGHIWTWLSSWYKDPINPIKMFWTLLKPLWDEKCDEFQNWTRNNPNSWYNIIIIIIINNKWSEEEYIYILFLSLFYSLIPSSLFFSCSLQLASENLAGEKLYLQA